MRTYMQYLLNNLKTELLKTELFNIRRATVMLMCENQFDTPDVEEKTKLLRKDYDVH